MTFKQTLIITAFAFTGWALCGMIMGLGPFIMTMKRTLIVHAIAAPVIFSLVSALYHKRFGYTEPLFTAIFFTTFVILIDFLIVATVIMKSYEMFTSFPGTWLPYILIFITSYLTGKFVLAKIASGDI